MSLRGRLAAAVVALAVAAGGLAAATGGTAVAAGETAPATGGSAAATGRMAVATRGTATAVAGPRVVLPPANAPFDYQLGGAYRPPSGVRIVVRDRGAAPVRGRYGVCYVNAFQTQPDEASWWKAEHPDLLLRRDGRPVADEDWPDEFLLDTATAAKREAIATIVGGWMDGCATAGFDAVEPDNLDSWTRSRGGLRRADNVALARLLTARAHAAGLAIAQKNAAELASRGRRIGFDFAIAEECQVYDECGAYTRAYGRRVLEVEYDDAGGVRNFRSACRARGRKLAVTYRDRDLVPRGAPGHAFRTC
ncbi:endo alpha-1,4 polygalactosaminidase [Patulibacter americanus]|uniref:endo alpha-1,4 polygalactosaminidase n=1 Tax=Patulibacter americanus TaxID=588672 RepID=UPI0003B68E7F|nr:endo alpha-1,4 polygalactosaminidase [Patulibacter americanus]